MNDLEKCKTCYHKYHRKWEAGICDYYYYECENNSKHKRYTNADAIRQMSDEELTEMLCNNTSGCDVCIMDSECRVGHNGFYNWLHKEAD